MVLTDKMIANTIEASLKTSLADILLIGFLIIIGLCSLFLFSILSVKPRNIDHDTKDNLSGMEYFFTFSFFVVFPLVMSVFLIHHMITKDEHPDFYVIETLVDDLNSDADGDYYVSFINVKGSLSIDHTEYAELKPGNIVYVAVDQKTGRSFSDCFWKVGPYQYKGNKFNYEDSTYMPWMDDARKQEK